jgi:hypothetical protein
MFISPLRLITAVIRLVPSDSCISTYRVMPKLSGEHVGRAVPSPEGRHLALLEWNTATDAWMIEHF